MDKIKKVLIITYYWPPSGGSGVQRWLKFAKYLPDFGVKPVVYTPSNPEVPVLDNSLLSDIPESVEVVKQPIREPYGIYKKLTGKKKSHKVGTGFISENKKPGVIENLAIWVRGNFFIPDPRNSWVKPSVRYLKTYLLEHDIDTVITTGPPHSMHLIGLRLKKKLNIRWIADFRDPWTSIDFYKDLKLTRFADQEHKRLEEEVLKNADDVITVTPGMCREFEKKGANPVHLITNGYDTDNESVEKTDKEFVLAHIGTLVPSRNPEMLWEVLGDFCKEIEDFRSNLKIRLIGKVDVSVKDCIEKNALTDLTEYIDYVPHKEVRKWQQRSFANLLIVNDTPNAKGILTGKVFEYMASERPILAIAPEDGDLANVLKESNTGVTVGFGAKEALKTEIAKLYHAYKSEQDIQVNANYSQFSRKALTERLVEILNY